MPVETEFAGGFEFAQDVEIREKNAGHKRTMHVEECTQSCLEHEETQKPIDRMPKIM